MKRTLLLLIRGYQLFVSPVIPRSCRFQPTCSQYALEAVTRYGAVKGLSMAAWRVLRCNPFGRGGHDPVS